MAGRLVVIGQTRPVSQVRQVYFIRAERLGLIKIGVSDDSRSRLKQLADVIPDDLTLLGVVICENRGRLEKDLHRAFAAYRVRGEWFSAAPELVAYIKENADHPPPRKRFAA